MSLVNKILPENSRVLFLFPHFDDCAFVSSGLIKLAKKIGCTSKVVVLYEKVDKVAELEFDAYTNYLGVSDTAKVLTTHSKMVKDVEKQIKDFKADSVVTFDPGGVTGNSHHTLTSLKTYEVIRNISKSRPNLLWRVADKEEEKHFGKMPKALGKDYANVFELNLKMRSSLQKIKAIFMNKSRMNSWAHKLRIFEWYLFDHKEIYYKVDFKKDKLTVNYAQAD